MLDWERISTAVARADEDADEDEQRELDELARAVRVRRTQALRRQLTGTVHTSVPVSLHTGRRK